MTRLYKPRDALPRKPVRKPTKTGRGKAAKPLHATMTHTGTEQQAPGWGVHQQDEP